MATKEVKFDYFLVKTPGQTHDVFDQNLINENQLINKTEVDVFGYTLRIGSMRKLKRNISLPDLVDNYLWVVSVERINLTDEAYVGKKGKAGRATYAANPDEGPLSDTVFLYDPKTAVIIVQRARGGVNQSGMINYISKLCKVDEVELEVMIDPKVLDKLDKIPMVKSIEYSIATPTQLGEYKDDQRGIFGDIKLAKLLGGSNLKLVIGADKNEYLETKKAIEKVKMILKTSQKVSVMKVNGTKDGEEEILDLINKRIQYKERINPGRGKKVSYVHIMDTIENAYRSREKIIIDYTK
ncbi:hypothetical protein FZC76_16070 [Sutcliffiella horikoshii]|uniref:Uncharacterized protein n=1 Tax=Sutcliffiella horikoshii TaxID=79883 RepID=A0A5D4SXV0_9BACI|nr:DUF6731 family protein [Sutcliffiella horikoshii]TYS67042.1 hypothetical protein FZC76_16070 [Sutcliffiella horikoshii]